MVSVIQIAKPSGADLCFVILCCIHKIKTLNCYIKAHVNHLMKCNVILMFCQQSDADMTTLVECVSIDCLVASDRQDDVVVSDR